MRGQPVIIGARQYHVVPDIDGRDRVFFVGRVVDDADGRAMARDVQVSSAEPMVFAAQSDAEVGLAGNPAVAFADRAVAHSTTLTLGARGYRRLTQAVTLPAFAALPQRVDMAMRRMPFHLAGRVFGRSAGPNPTFDPVAGATISLTPIAAPGGELPLLLRQPLRADVGAGASLRRRAISPLADVVAIADAAAGTVLLEIADGTGVLPGHLLRVGPVQRCHYAQITSVIAHPDRPAPAALLRLSDGLAGSIRTDTVLERFSQGGFSGVSAGFVGAAYADEAVVWLSALPASGGVLVLREAGQPDRFHDAHILTGPAGDYLCPGMARLGTASFDVSAPGFTTSTDSFRASTLRAGPLDWYLAP